MFRKILTLKIVQQDIISLVNLQHNCHRGKCDTTGTQALRQEREATTRSRAVVSHSDQTHFIVNTQSLHNYQHIFNAIPISLRGSSFNIIDPIGLRNQAAAILRDKKQQQVEARKVLSMAAVMGRDAAPSGSANAIPGDEEPNAPLEPRTEAQDTLESLVEPNDPLLPTHFPSGLPVFLQSIAGTSTQAQGSISTAMPTTLYVTV